jgi:hypothetical protein
LEDSLLTTLPSGQKLKRKLPRQRACNELNDKGKICAGHLKRFYDPIPNAPTELYRCEKCKTLYAPADSDVRRTGTLAW